MQHFDFPLPNPLRVFKMVEVPQQEYPLVCISVSRGLSPSLPVNVKYMNLNSNTSWFTSSGLGRLTPRDYVCYKALEHKEPQTQHGDLNSHCCFCCR